LQQAEHCNQEAAESESAFSKQNKVLACSLTQKSSQAEQVNLSSDNRHSHTDASQSTDQ